MSPLGQDVLENGVGRDSVLGALSVSMQTSVSPVFRSSCCVLCPCQQADGLPQNRGDGLFHPMPSIHGAAVPYLQQLPRFKAALPGHSNISKCQGASKQCDPQATRQLWSLLCGTSPALPEELYSPAGQGNAHSLSESLPREGSWHGIQITFSVGLQYAWVTNQFCTRPLM